MKTINPGSALPSFGNLKGVDGILYASDSFNDAPFLLIIFTCNHCPYVKAYEDRMIRLAKDYKQKGLAIIAINSNEDKNYPEDSFNEMVKRAREKAFPFPYVRDEDQSAARAFGAAHTPEFFLFDGERKLRYHGRLDDNWREPDKVTRQYLKEALDALVAGKEVAEPEVYSIGCTIKWK
jgi:thiol-disulfide isomerase/thioredoxin